VSDAKPQIVNQTMSYGSSGLEIKLVLYFYCSVQQSWGGPQTFHKLWLCIALWMWIIPLTAAELLSSWPTAWVKKGLYRVRLKYRWTSWISYRGKKDHKLFFTD